MTAYYNEHEPYAAQWLRNLIAAGHIAPGAADARDIQDVTPDDLTGYTQCHFFAGVGGFSYALRLAGWPDDEPVWTGSCPCQPLSSAGQRKGAADERHLWPAFFELIAECRPPTAFGEQVASRLGREWFAGVRLDLESVAYAVWGADLPAASVGAPHIRQRLWWVAERLADAERAKWRALDSARGTARSDSRGPKDGQEGAGRTRSGGEDGGLGDAVLLGRVEERQDTGGRSERGATEGREQRPWDNSGLIGCADGHARRIPQSGIFPLAHGIPGRVGQLRAYGNAIVPILAARFIQGYMEI